MKLEEWESYAKELATKAGLEGEQAEKWLEVFKTNDKIREGFVPRSEYSRDLDSVRDKTAKEVKDKTYEEARKYYQNWVDKEVEPQRKQALAAIDQLAKYREAYGELTGDGNGGTPPPATSGLSKEDVQKLLLEQLTNWQPQIVNRQKASMKIATQHLKEFNEVLDPDELEKFAQEHNYTEIGPAYDAFVKPRREELSAKQQEEALKKAREEGFKEGRSQSSARTAHEREYANPFLAERPKDIDPRAEFFAGLEGDSNQ